jgi:thymidine phosphorylase
VRPLGTRVEVGDALLRVHAASRESACAALARLGAALDIVPGAVAPGPVLIERQPAG